MLQQEQGMHKKIMDCKFAEANDYLYLFRECIIF